MLCCMRCDQLIPEKRNLWPEEHDVRSTETGKVKCLKMGVNSGHKVKTCHYAPQRRKHIVAALFVHPVPCLANNFETNVGI